MPEPRIAVATSLNTDTATTESFDYPESPNGHPTLSTEHNPEPTSEDTSLETAKEWLLSLVPSENGNGNQLKIVTMLMDNYGLSKPIVKDLLKEYDSSTIDPILDIVEADITRNGGPNLKALAGPPLDICVNPGRQHTTYDSIMKVLPFMDNLYYTGKFLTKYCCGTKRIKYTVGKGKFKETKYIEQTGYIDPVDDSWLSINLPRYASFYKKLKAGKTTPADPPPTPIRAVLKSSIFPGVLELIRIVKAPYLNANLEIQTPGYDEYTSTMVLYNYKIKPLPAKPTREDAIAAAKAILEYVCQFPFESPTDQAVWLAALLTGIQRPMIKGNTIGFAFIGNKPAIGKGLLVDIIMTTITGECASTTHYPTDIGEACKLKISLALCGASYVFYDNLPNGSTYGNGSLDSAITNPKMKDRILGGNANTDDIAFAPLWLLAGNNITPEADAWRRWLVCNLITELLNPETRDDIEDRDILGTIKAARADIIYNVLLILKAHALDGYPDDDWSPLGSFYEWDKIIRGAVWFATGVDCDTGRKAIATECPDYINRVELLEVLTTTFGQSMFTIDDVWAIANETDKVNPFVWIHPEIRTALFAYSKSPNNLPPHNMVGKSSKPSVDHPLVVATI